MFLFLPIFQSGHTCDVPSDEYKFYWRRKYEQMKFDQAMVEKLTMNV